MEKMKKAIILALALTMLLGLAACAGPEPPATLPETAPTAPDGTETAPSVTVPETQPERPLLTMEELLTLSEEYEDRLNEEDFEDFSWWEAQPHCRVYPIDDQFSLCLTYVAPPSNPANMLLFRNDDPLKCVDVRNFEELGPFLQSCREGTEGEYEEALDQACGEAILDYVGTLSWGEKMDFELESHWIYDTRIQEAPNGAHTATVYLEFVCNRFLVDGKGELAYDIKSGWSSGAMLTFRIDQAGNCTLTEFWVPERGNYFDDIQEKYPRDVLELLDQSWDPTFYLMFVNEQKAIACLPTYLESLEG